MKLKTKINIVLVCVGILCIFVGTNTDDYFFETLAGVLFIAAVVLHVLDIFGEDKKKQRKQRTKEVK